MAVGTVYYADDYPSGAWEVSTGGTATRYWVFKANFPAAGFVVNDVIACCPIPGNFVLTDFFFDGLFLDTGTAVTLDIGDSGGVSANNTNAAIFYSNVVLGQSSLGFRGNNMCAMTSTGTAVLAAVAGGTPRAYADVAPSSNVNFIIKIHTAPTTTSVTGTIKGFIRGASIGHNVPTGI